VGISANCHWFSVAESSGIFYNDFFTVTEPVKVPEKSRAAVRDR
jgi:hypothetical protein